jgi:hypothetical protein
MRLHEHEIRAQSTPEVVDETEHVWLLVDGKDPKAEPLPIPKHGDEVEPEVLDSLAHRSPGLSQAIMGAVRKHVAPKTPLPPKP